MVTFEEKNHKYSSIDIFDDIKWVSASKLAGLFKKPFDQKKKSESCSKNRNSKWYGISPEEIVQIWQNENIRSTTLGTWYHNKEEQKLITSDTEEFNGQQLPIIRPIWEGDKKIAPEQKLSDGIYPEHLAYLRSVGVCGQFDKIIICDGFIYNDDYKSNKDLKKPAYVNWEGKIDKMCSPLLHLDDCKLVEYGLQLSIGTYIISRHNPKLKIGKQNLHHITFEIEGEDKFGYPIMRLDENKEPIIKGIEKIEVPYMKREVELIFEWLKTKNYN